VKPKAFHTNLAITTGKVLSASQDYYSVFWHPAPQRPHFLQKGTVQLERFPSLALELYTKKLVLIETSYK